MVKRTQYLSLNYALPNFRSQLQHRHGLAHHRTLSDETVRICSQSSQDIAVHSRGASAKRQL